VLVTLMLPWVRHAPGPGDHETTGEAARPATAAAAEGGPGLSPRQFLADPRFWAIGLSTAFAMAVFQTTLVSLVPIGREIGFSTTKAASLISAIGVAGISGKLLIAWFADRIDRALVLACLYALLALASVVLLAALNYLGMIVACVLIGLAAGATMPLCFALLADLFGARSFATGSGMVTFVIAVISAAGVRYSGEVYDRTGHYDIMFYSFIVIGLLSALLMLAVSGIARKRTLAPAE
jgi:cyanate permease